MSAAPPGLHPVKGFFGVCHILVDNQHRVTIVDTGLLGYAAKFRRTFRDLRLEPAQVDAILLTHGHLDHTGNAAWLKDWTRAPVYAHALEQPHIGGRYPYRGLARVCGAMESLGRAVSGYRAVSIDCELTDGQELPFWGGLRVVHLPGHTLGHCGFWSERLQLLFIGDLVAIWPWRSTYPPPIFNSAGHLLPASLRRAAALRPRLVVPNHYITLDHARLARQFEAFARRKRCWDQA